MSNETPTHRCANCGVTTRPVVGDSMHYTDRNSTAARFPTLRFPGLDRCTADPLSRAFPIHAMERIR